MYKILGFIYKNTMIILPSSDDYVHIFPSLKKKPQSRERGSGKSILSGRVFEPAEPMQTEHVAFNPSNPSSIRRNVKPAPAKHQYAY